MVVGVKVPSNMALSIKLMVKSVHMIWKICLRSSTATLLSMASITRQQTSTGLTLLSNMELVVRPLELLTLILWLRETLGSIGVFRTTKCKASCHI